MPSVATTTNSTVARGCWSATALGSHRDGTRTLLLDGRVDSMGSVEVLNPARTTQLRRRQPTDASADGAPVVGSRTIPRHTRRYDRLRQAGRGVTMRGIERLARTLAAVAA